MRVSNPPPMRRHTPETVQAVADLYTTGISVRHVAARAGLTRGQVAGLLSRHGLINRRSTSVPKERPALDPAQPRRNPLAGPFPSVSTCQYILGEINDFDHMCGSPTQKNSSYCPDHHRLCHKPPETTNE